MAFHLHLLYFGPALRLYGNMKNLTRVDETVGMPEFMSPEQIEGNEIDFRSDVFSLGVLLYLAATKRYPFSGANLGAALNANLAGDLREPSSVHGADGTALKRVIATSLQRAPAHRFASTGDMRLGLEKMLRQ